MLNFLSERNIQGSYYQVKCDIDTWCDLISDNNHLTMRGNSIGTKAMEAYMKLVGEKVRKVITQSKGDNFYFFSYLFEIAYILRLPSGCFDYWSIYSVLMTNHELLSLISRLISKRLHRSVVLNHVEIACIQVSVVR